MIKSNWILGAVVLLLTLLLLEGAAHLTYFFYFGHHFSYTLAAQKRLSILHANQDLLVESGGAVTDPFAPIAAHPYLGYSYASPGTAIRELANSLEYFPPSSCKVNEQGLLSVGNGDPLHVKTDQVVVVVTGGSVANQFTCTNGSELARRLESLQRFKGKSVLILGAALGAWRQPQQLIALSYLLSIGVKPALVINLDGFNESSNVYLNVNTYPIYPHFWPRLTSGFDLGRAKFVGRIDLYRSIEGTLSRVSGYFPYSATVGTVFELACNIIDAKIMRINQLLVEASEKSFTVTGPIISENNRAELSLDVWLNSSIAMARLAREYGFVYEHFYSPPQRSAVQNL